MNWFRKEQLGIINGPSHVLLVGAHTGTDTGEQVGNIIKCFNVHSARLSKPIPTNLSYWEKWKSVQDLSVSDVPSSRLLPGGQMKNNTIVWQ